MNLFSSITPEEQSAICDYIENYADDEYGCRNCEMNAPLEHILRFWETNKIKLFQLFNGQLILRKEVSLKVTDDDLARIIQQFLDEEGAIFLKEYRTKVLNHVNFDNYFWLSHLATSVKYLQKNLYEGPTFKIETPRGRTLTVNHGCKIMKILGKIATDWHLEGFEQFRIGHSMCLNNAYTYGTLCLSIHPLDYFTMSDNDCDWSSCMSWQEWGGWRQGTVEMMNSPYIVIAYLESSHPMTINGNFLWNNKKWRELFLVTPQMLLGIEGYPFSQDECENLTLNWLQELAEKNLGYKYSNSVFIDNHKQNQFSETCFGYVSLSSNLMFNDISWHHAARISNNIFDVSEQFRLNFSGESECVLCGEEINDLDADSADLACSSCLGRYRCASCGCRIDFDQVFEFEGDYYCEDCFDQTAINCDICGEPIRRSEICTVHEQREGIFTGSFIRVCPNCFKTRLKKDVNQFESYDVLDTSIFHKVLSLTQ